MLRDKILELATHDFQNRGNEYPKPDIAESIGVYEKDEHTFEVWAYFKDTSEKTAKDWFERYLKDYGIITANIHTWQDGDYKDDWVRVHAIIII